MKEYSGTDPLIFIYVNCFSITLTNVVIYSFGYFSLKTKSNIFGIINGQVGVNQIDRRCLFINKYISVIRTLLIWRHQSIKLTVYGEIRQPFDAKMCQLFQTNKLVIFQLPCVQVIWGLYKTNYTLVLNFCCLEMCSKNQESPGVPCVETQPFSIFDFCENICEKSIVCVFAAEIYREQCAYEYGKKISRK